MDNNEEKEKGFPTNEEIIEEITKHLNSTDINLEKCDSPEEEFHDASGEHQDQNKMIPNDEDEIDPEVELAFKDLEDCEDPLANEYENNAKLLEKRDSKLSDNEKEEFIRKAESIKESGNELFRKKEFEKAALKYTEALKLYPLNCKKERAINFANRGAARSQYMDPVTALSDCEKAVEIDPQYLKAHLRCAHLYEQIDKPELSLQSYKKILQLDPKHEVAQLEIQRLEPLVNERNEKLKAEMIEKLKDFGNIILKPFGLSTNNFEMKKDESTGNYSVNLKQNTS